MTKLQKAVNRKQSQLGEIRKQNTSTPRQSVPSSDLQRAVDHPELAKPSTLRALSRHSGNRSVSGLLQAKMLVDDADDFYEREADQVASSVVQAMASPPLPGVQREDIDGVQRLSNGLDSNAGFDISPEIEGTLSSRRGDGSPLPDTLRASMEPQFGADFSSVRLHTGEEADQITRSLQAKAFTHGSDIYFGEGQYHPATQDGQRLLAHELTHTIQQGAALQQKAQRKPHITHQGKIQTIRRKTFSPSEILNALLKIPFVKERLSQTQHLRRDDRVDKAPNVETMKAHISEVLSMYNQNLRGTADKSTSHAISLAVVLEGVARIIAVNELNDPMLTPVLTMKLIELYRDEISNALGKMDEKEDVIRQATALTAGDPVGLYMHDELRIEEAARQVRKQAMLAGKEPVEFFDLLRQRFEIEMSTQTEKKVSGQQDTASVFSVKEATGEISMEYLKRLFPRVAQGKKPAQVNPTWQKGKTKGERSQLVFTPEAARKLDALKTAVGQHDLGFTGPNRTFTREGETATNTLTTRQSAHLEEIEQKDATVNRVSLDDLMRTRLQAMFSLDEDSAVDLLNRIKAGLSLLPLTITVKASDWFSSGSPTSTIYRPGSSRKKEANFSDLFNKDTAKGKINYLGEFDDHTGQGRGKNYGRFRNWKDQRMTGGRGFSDKELPSFGAVNLNWAAHSTDKTYGVNSYGDLHFILKKQNVANRLVYTATDHGHPRRDIYLAFCDFVLGDSPEKSLTGLKKTESSHVVKQIVNSLVTQQLVRTPLQCFEIQIFGEVDIAKDVQKIAIAPSTDASLKLNVEAFCNRHNIAYEAIAMPTEAVLDGKWFTPMPGNKGRDMTEQLQDALRGSQLPTGY